MSLLELLSEPIFSPCHLDKQRGVGGVSEGTAAAHLAHTDAAHEVHEAGGEPGGKHGVAREVVQGHHLGAHRVGVEGLDLAGEHDGDYEAVDGDSLAEDDGDQVLGLDPRGLDATANNTDQQVESIRVSELVNPVNQLVD